MRTKETLRYGVAGMTFLLAMAIISCGFQKKQSETANPATTPEVGTLTAYYAEEDFAVNDETQYTKGELICDSNDPINRVVDLDDNFFKYEGDDTGEYYSWQLPKPKVKEVAYKMNQLPVEMIGDKAIFKSEQGLIAKIFKSDINGHKYFSLDADDDFKAFYDEEETKRHADCLVLSVEYTAKWVEGKGLFEIELNVEDGNIKMYNNNRFYDGNSPEDCRYRKGMIGFIEEEWSNEEGWEEAAYSEDGKLLVDRYSVEGSIPEYCSIAYIADKDALYYNGTLYYRQK